MADSPAVLDKLIEKVSGLSSGGFLFFLEMVCRNVILSEAKNFVHL